MLEGFSGGLIIAIIDFLMVFLVLGGLAAMIVGLKKVVAFLEIRKVKSLPEPQPVSPKPVTEPPGQTDEIKAHIAAILVAVQEFTSLPAGSFKIDRIEPIDTASAPTKAQIAAIAVAIHEFSSMPMGSFRITAVKPLRRVNTWKIAGRLELMGMDVDVR